VAGHRRRVYDGRSGGRADLAWLAGRSAGVFETATTWAGIVGAVGFCGGFFGPMVFAPQANQGPLLGLFITGPLGLVAGGAGGLIYTLWRRSRMNGG